MARITVNLAQNPYDVVIEPGALRRIGELIAQIDPDARALLAVDRRVAQAGHAAPAAESLRAAGYEVAIHEMAATERGKSLSAVRKLYGAMLEAHLERGSPVIALGGGIVGDIAGFAAATYLRGVPLVHAPTTLLAMVDAAIGGKTGVNWPSALGSRFSATDSRQSAADSPLIKNLIGAFWQPRIVIADPEVLSTLSQRDFRCGLAECIKHGMIADAGLLDFISENLDRILAMEMAILSRLIARSAAVKAKIVASDEREHGERALLNLGHTFGHAIEAAAGRKHRHGEAVAIGLVAAMHVSTALGRLSAAEAERIRSLLRDAGLPIALESDASIARLISMMRYDKKVRHDRLRLILPTGPGRAEIADDVPHELIERAWAAVGADHRTS